MKVEERDGGSTLRAMFENLMLEGIVRDSGGVFTCRDILDPARLFRDLEAAGWCLMRLRLVRISDSPWRGYAGRRASRSCLRSMFRPGSRPSRDPPPSP